MYDIRLFVKKTAINLEIIQFIWMIETKNIS